MGCIRLKKMAGLFAALLLLPALAFSQTSPIDGLKDNTPAVHAFTGATVVVSPGNVIQNATVVVRNGVIVAAGENVTPPADARIWDMSGKTLYPKCVQIGRAHV